MRTEKLQKQKLNVVLHTVCDNWNNRRNNCGMRVVRDSPICLTAVLTHTHTRTYTHTWAHIFVCLCQTILNSSSCALVTVCLPAIFTPRCAYACCRCLRALSVILCDLYQVRPNPEGSSFPLTPSPTCIPFANLDLTNVLHATTTEAPAVR